MSLRPQIGNGAQNRKLSMNGGGGIPVSSFVFTVDTTQAGSAADTFILPLNSGETYNFTVKWGDGNEDVITAWNDVALTHVYSSSGTYQIQVDGTFPRIHFDDLGDKEKMSSISVRFNERTHGRSNTSWATAFELLMKVVVFRFVGIRKWSKKFTSSDV